MGEEHRPQMSGTPGSSIVVNGPGGRELFEMNM